MFRAVAWGAAGVAILGSACGGAASAAEPAPSVRIAYDPAVRRGTLANGMRFVILRNAKPAGAVSLRLGMDVGSWDEDEAERGYAHFVEHMAFNGTRHFAEDKIGAAFAAQGVEFGRDLNAFTSLRDTFYQLNLPAADRVSLDTGLDWLRDAADGVAFSEDAVARERGVVLAEAEARNSVAAMADRVITRFQAPELRSTRRDPGGELDIVRTATGARLKAFYDRWYRPENAVLIVVGDLPEAELEARIRAAFDDWRGRGPAGVRPAATALAERGLEAFVRADPGLPTSVGACRFRAPDPAPAGSFEAYRGETIARIALMILNRRLAARAEDADNAFVSAGAYQDGSTRDATKTCLAISPARDAWEPATAAAQAVLLAFEAQGPSEREVEQAIEELRSGMRGGVSSAPSRQSAPLADGLLRYELARDVFPAPYEAIRVFDRAVENLTPEMVQARFRRDWAGAGPRLSLITPAAADPAKVAAFWRDANAGRPLAAHVERQAAAWAYRDFGPKGSVARRETIADPGFVRVRFGNGVVLNVKRTDHQRGQANVRVRFGEGWGEIADGDYYAALFGAALFQSGGLGRHSAEALDTLFRNIDWGADLTVNENGFVLSGATAAASLGRELEVLAAFTTDPGFRPDIDRMLPTSVDQWYRAVRTTPDSVVGDALIRGVAPASPQALPPKETLLRLGARDFDRVFRPALTKAPLEITIVGDVDEKVAIDEVARTFGALPRRAPRPQARKNVWVLRFPDAPVAPISARHEGPPDKAVANLVWPLWVGDPARRREEYAAHLLADVFSDKLRQRVREELGKTYAPSAGLVMSDATDQGRLVASVETRPQDLDEAAAEVRAVAARLAAGEIAQADLDTVRKPMLAQFRADRSGNDWWLSALDGSAADPRFLRDLREFEAVISGITVADLQAAAAKWLAPAPILAVARPAAETSQAGRP